MRKRVRQLDGVRGIAVLLVLFAHLLDGVAPHNRRLFSFVPEGFGGGFVGVQLFFALSGYLITSILADEITSNGTLDFLGFYKRRARRLLPALFAISAVYVALALFILPRADRAAALGDVVRAVTYTTNIPPAWRSLPDSHWLQHCWSLAVEEQFYLLWPPALLIAWKLLGRRGAIYVALFGALATAALRVVPPLFRYSYEVLRWDALMCGCLLALVRPKIPVWIHILSIAVLVFYLIVPLTVPQLKSYSYLLTAIASAGFIDFARTKELAKNSVLCYFGRISYALYLWHAFLMRFDVSPWIAGPVSVAISELSYRIIEAPFLVRSQKQEADAKPNASADPVAQPPG